MSCGCCAGAVPLWVTMGLLELRAKGVMAMANGSRPSMVGLGAQVASGLPEPPVGWFQELEVVASYRVYKWPEPSLGEPPPDGPVFQRMYQRTWRRTHEGEAVVRPGQVIFEDFYDESDPLTEGEFFGMEPDGDPDDYAGDWMEYSSSELTATGEVTLEAQMSWAQQQLGDAPWTDYSSAASNSPAVGFGVGVTAGITKVPWNAETPGEVHARVVHWRVTSSIVLGGLEMIDHPDGQYKLLGTVGLWEAEMTEEGGQEDAPTIRRVVAPWNEQEARFRMADWEDLGMPSPERFAAITEYAWGIDISHVFHE